ncbi:hypothetical protein MTR67_018393, partial [Solanum verrucosum]
MKNSSVPSPEGRNQVDDEKEQSVNCRVVSWSKDRSPKVTELDDAECLGEKAMEEVKGWLIDWFGVPD